jgi:hypothetical protein
MIASPLPNYRYQTSSCWFTARRNQARTHLLDSQTIGLAITPQDLQRPHLHRVASPDRLPKSHPYLPLAQLISIALVPKSP